MSSSGIHFSGVASGLNVDSIISSLMTIEGLPIQRMQTTQAHLQSQQAALASFRSQLQSVGSAIANLGQKSTYNPVSATSSDTSVASVSAGSNSGAGVFNLEVTNLAQNHKLASGPQASATDALSLSGRVIINGKAMDVQSTDNLTSIASRITNLGVGVSASVINGGTGQAYISMSSSSTGIDSSIQMADASGGVLSSLGLVSGSSTVRNSPAAHTALSYGFADATSNIATLTGLTSSTGNIVLNGVSVALDFSSDSLQSVSDKINAATTGITSTVVSSTQNGKTVQKLQLSGAGVPSGITDSDGMLAQMGVMQRSFGNELQAAQDASFKIDGLPLTSSTNQVTSVIPGATITLLKKNSSATINLTRDVSQIKQAITGFQSAFNSMNGLIKQATSYNKDAGTTGVLFGDQSVQAVQQGLSSMLFSTLGSGKYTNLTQVGVGLDQDGNISIDDTKLSNALNNNLPDVMNLLMATGSTSNAQLTYVSSSEKTKSTTSGSYEVNITQVATKTKATGALAQASPTAAGEILSFGGQMFGSTPISLALDAGMNASDIVNKINSDARLKDSILASLDVSGKLVVDSKRYGVSGQFTLSSNQSASTSNSGIGTPTLASGVDVAGTINGETATGSGQYLLGSVGNAKTEGLQVQYTGSTTGSAGSVTFTGGAANSIRSKISSFLDSVNGLLTIEDKSLQSQVDDITKSIADAQAGLTTKEQFYRDKFTAMESAMSALQSQSGQLNSMFGTSSSSTSSSSSA